MRRILSTAKLACQTTWNLSKVIRALGNCSVQPRMNAGDMSMPTESICSGGQPCAASSVAMAATVLTSRPSATASTLR